MLTKCFDLLSVNGSKVTILTTVVLQPLWLDGLPCTFLGGIIDNKWMFFLIKRKSIEYTSVGDGGPYKIT